MSWRSDPGELAPAQRGSLSGRGASGSMRSNANAKRSGWPLCVMFATTSSFQVKAGTDQGQESVAGR